MTPPRWRALGATLLTALAVLSTAAAPAHDLFDDIYARGRDVERSLKTVAARFTETSTNRMLATPLVARGTLAVVRPDKIVLHYTEPDTRDVLIDGSAMTMTWPSRALVQTTDIGAARKRIDKYFVDKSPDQLRHAFRISAVVATDRPNTWRITMDPTRSQIRQGLTTLHLWIDRTSMMLSAMRFDFPNGDTKTMTFEDVVLNGPIDPKTFAVGGPSR